MTSEDAIKRSFPPVADERTRMLILGSLPGDASLASARYYAHPRNQFWRLVGAATGLDLEPMAYPERLAALLAAGVGLWDVVETGRRRGSLDTAIRDYRANALGEFAAGLPALRAVAFNGGKAAALGRRLLEHRSDLELIVLPSSSPAFTAPFGVKAEQWMRLRAVLETD